MTIAVLWTLVPLAWGYAIARFVPGLYLQAVGAWELLFGVFWFWVGMRFAQLKPRPLTGFVVGNAAWAISLAVYAWQFLLLGGAQRGAGMLTLLPQAYPLGLTAMSARLAGLFQGEVTGTTTVLVAYGLMLLLFAGGFVFERRRADA